VPAGSVRHGGLGPSSAPPPQDIGQILFGGLRFCRASHTPTPVIGTTRSVIKRATEGAHEHAQGTRFLAPARPRSRVSLGLSPRGTKPPNLGCPFFDPTVAWSRASIARTSTVNSYSGEAVDPTQTRPMTTRATIVLRMLETNRPFSVIPLRGLGCLLNGRHRLRWLLQPGLTKSGQVQESSFASRGARVRAQAGLRSRHREILKKSALPKRGGLRAPFDLTDGHWWTSHGNIRIDQR
jgi:hypothetical protein